MRDIDIKMCDFDYSLPEERIAKYPLDERDSSKLLVYREGNISEHVFRDMPDMLPDDAMMGYESRACAPAFHEADRCAYRDFLP